jgi:single-strand DNA-binding protein
MLNQVVLVGRLTKDVEIKEEGEKKKANIELAVGRQFKNADGEYENDFITCELWNGVANSVSEWCKKGDLVGVKGRLQTTKVENEDGTFEYKQEVIAEKVTFLSSRKPEDK